VKPTNAQAEMAGFWAGYLRYPDLESASPLASPVRADASLLRSFAPSFVFTAEFDTLRDEAEAFGFALKDTGAITCVRR
jgi:acetyl esterase